MRVPFAGGMMRARLFGSAKKRNTRSRGNATQDSNSSRAAMLLSVILNGRVASMLQGDSDRVNLTLADVQRAQEMLRRYLPVSRMLAAPSLSQEGCTVSLKLESELPTGAFKVRGALYALATRLAQRPTREVTASSTGNHGAGVAFAARQLGVAATIFLPRNPNPIKRRKVRFPQATRPGWVQAFKATVCLTDLAYRPATVWALARVAQATPVVMPGEVVGDGTRVRSKAPFRKPCNPTRPLEMPTFASKRGFGRIGLVELRAPGSLTPPATRHSTTPLPTRCW